MKKLLLQKSCILIILFLSGFNANSCSAQVAPPDSVIMAQMSSYHSPGVSALIIKKGFPVWKGTFGFANLEDSIPVAISTDFMLASVSKTVTATAIMNVQENGGFQLDENINNYLPFSVVNPHFPDDTITFRDLLTHTSSIKDNWNVLDDLYVNGDSPIPLGDFMNEYLISGGQYFDPVKNFYNIIPGSDYNYANEGVALCGFLVETITGIPFSEYCNDSIFIPLCMNQTGWFLSSIDTGNLAMPYDWQGGSYLATGFYGYPDYPDGQLRTNALALGRFLDMYMNHGSYNGHRILDSSTVALMLSLQIPSIDPTQGIVWYKSTIGGRSCWGHNGGDIGVSTNMFFSPQDSTGIILLSNGGFFTNTVMDAMFDYAETLEPPLDSVFDCGFVFTNDEVKYENHEFIIFPNPSAGIYHLQLSSNEKSDLRISDISGHLILHRTESGSAVLDLTNESSGIYIMQIKTSHSFFWRKLIKQ